ncbi:MAG: hypothetical protein P4L44_03175 [Oryzomonas sp.]|uniref:hypothetical protein n=1 Tax=Oryzomonas sp. TaxID=2855186 RepID=UPI0028474F9C|nr:hypothetical protein [Oryzomonas sp.]MDR3578947.1 hypothetical protein [Oryzomonas sp.]
MHCYKTPFLLFLLFLTACAAHHGDATSSDDYVEISNPFYTSSPNAPATIWVPRSSVDSGVPRATELVKKGVEKVSEAMSNSKPASGESAVTAPATQALPVPVPVSAQPLPATVPLKSRMAVLEAKDNGLILPLSNKLEHFGAGILLDHQQPSFLAKYSDLSNMADWPAVSVRLQQEFGTTVSVFVWVPDQVAPGKTILGTVYDGLSGGVVKTVVAQIPSYAPTDPAARNAALDVALDELAGKLKAVSALLPWYGKVVAVGNGRVYVNAGSEAGLRVGQVLKVYRGGKAVPGVGFVPGEQVATVEIRGFAGVNGAYGVIKDGKGVQAEDMIAVE